MVHTSSLQELSIFLALILIILTSGCAGPKLRTYSGDEIQKSEVAVIQGRYYFTPLYYDSVIIYNIDDGKFLGVTSKKQPKFDHQ
jgi:hypothetical protein